MPKLLPDGLAPYDFHGVEFAWNGRSKEALAQCPFCGKENHLTVDVETGKGRCLVCGEGTLKGGFNPIVFLRKLWEYSYAKTFDYRALVENRGLLYSDTLAKWNVARSIITSDWLLPGYSATGDLIQLETYRIGGKLSATTGLPRGLFAPGGNVKDLKPTVFICEGPWDGMALWETLGRTKRGGVSSSLAVTGNIASSLLADHSVVAVPACGTFAESWLPLFADREVTLMYDSDHPKQNGKCPGHEGMQRAAGLLSACKTPPSAVYYLRWGDEGCDSKLPDGYDVRDWLTEKRSA